MIEFLASYTPQIALFGGILATFSPFIRSRIINDKNMLSKFSEVKNLTSIIHTKEVAFGKSLTKINKSIETIAIGEKVYTDHNGFRIDPKTDYSYKKNLKSLFFISLSNVGK
jgi:hypothetical protein